MNATPHHPKSPPTGPVLLPMCGLRIWGAIELKETPPTPKPPMQTATIQWVSPGGPGLQYRTSGCWAAPGHSSTCAALPSNDSGSWRQRGGVLGPWRRRGARGGCGRGEAAWLAVEAVHAAAQQHRQLGRRRRRQLQQRSSASCGGRRHLWSSSFLPPGVMSYIWSPRPASISSSS